MSQFLLHDGNKVDGKVKREDILNSPDDSDTG